MTKPAVIAAIVVLAMAGAVGAGIGAAIPASVKRIAKSELKDLGVDPVIVDAVAAQNAKGMPLQKIEELDAAWIAATEPTAFMTALMENNCAVHLRELRAGRPYLVEIFVMDNQGAIVATTNRTTDYWQGDEPKWQESYKGGTGAVFIDGIALDESSGVFSVQVSVPVMDGKRAIGAVTFTVDVDQVR